MKWQPHRQQRPNLPRTLKDWLLDRGSLTERLISASHGAFRVELLGQHWSIPRLDESRILGIKPRQSALIREVILYGNNQPWVYARSVLPAKSLNRSLRHLKRLGNKPLGAVLFSDPHMQRGEIEVACFMPNELPVPSKQRTWGRRSVFFLHHKPLLVSEIFLPTFIIPVC